MPPKWPPERKNTMAEDREGKELVVELLNNVRLALSETMAIAVCSQIHHRCNDFCISSMTPCSSDAPYH